VPGRSDGTDFDATGDEKNAEADITLSDNRDIAQVKGGVISLTLRLQSTLRNNLCPN